MNQESNQNINKENRNTDTTLLKEEPQSVVVTHSLKTKRKRANATDEESNKRPKKLKSFVFSSPITLSRRSLLSSLTKKRTVRRVFTKQNK
jgi:hypothetical protein